MPADRPFASPSGAIFSPRKTYRYALWRSWDHRRPRVAFIGLNPSTADGHHDDATIRRCIGFARAWGYGSVVVANLFAYCATNSSDLLRTERPEGRENGAWLDIAIKESDRVIACWGNHGRHQKQDMKFLARYDQLHCIAVNKAGAPTHPLYQPGSSIPVRYHPPANIRPPKSARQE